MGEPEPGTIQGVCTTNWNLQVILVVVWLRAVQQFAPFLFRRSQGDKKWRTSSPLVRPRGCCSRWSWSLFFQH